MAMGVIDKFMKNEHMLAKKTALGLRENIPGEGTGTKLLDIQTFERLRGELMVRKATPAVPRAAAPGNQAQALKRRRNIGPTQRLRLRGWPTRNLELGAVWGVV